MRVGFQTQGAPVLNCPGCKTPVADDAAICPSCDYIIDASFVSTNATDGEASGPSRKQGAARPARPRSPGSSRGVAAVSPRPRPTDDEPEAAPREDATNIRSAEDILRNAPPRATGARAGSGARAAAGRTSAPRRPAEPAADSGHEPAEAPAPRRGASRDTASLEAPEQAIEDFREFTRELGQADRIAFWSALVVIGSAFMPWLETAEDGDILGLVSLGFLCVLMSLGVIGAITVRTRRLLPQINVLVPWLSQLGLAIVCVVWCLIFMKLSYDATEVPSPIGNATIMNSSPSFGAYLGLLGTVGMLVGTLLGLKEKPAS